MEILGYILVALLTPLIIGIAIGAALKNGRGIKAFTLAPWKVHVEYEEK